MSSAVPAISPSRAARATNRANLLSFEGAYDVADRVSALERSGRRIANLSIGEPSFATPTHIVDAGVQALRDGRTRYTPVAGIDPLRAAIAESLRDRGIMTAAPENVLVTPGAKPALFYALLALLEPGDEILIPDPGFPAYASVAAFAGATTVTYRADIDDIADRVGFRTRVIVINSPANPGGATFTAAELERIGELAECHDVAIVSDGCYGRLTYHGGDSAPSVAALPGLAARTVVVDSFSKTYAMTGWRLGFALAPPRLARALQRLAVNGHSCTPAFVQHAGVAALTGPQGALHRMRAELTGRREVLVAALDALPGVSCAAPAGAFYAFADVSRAAARVGRSTQQFADWLLDEVGVAGVPGTAFGARGDGHIRFSFAAPPDQIALAIERLHGALPRAAR
jgi:aspartate/methionine/tyrosine aminotransferase